MVGIESRNTPPARKGSYSELVAVRVTPRQLELIDRLRANGSRSDVVRWALARCADVVERVEL